MRAFFAQFAFLLSRQVEFKQFMVKPKNMVTAGKRGPPRSEDGWSRERAHRRVFVTAPVMRVSKQLLAYYILH